MHAASSASLMRSDRECLEAWRRSPGAENLRPLVERYGAFVYSSAFRRTGSADDAAEATRAVFLVLARRARKLRKKTVLAGWLFHVTAVACRKLKRGRTRWWRWSRGKPRNQLPPDATLWSRVAPNLDQAIDRLPARLRDAVLLRVLLDYDWKTTTEILRTSEPRARKRVRRGLVKIARRLRRTRVTVDSDTFAQLCSANACATPPLNDLNILVEIEVTVGKKPTCALARRTLNTLAWARWRRRFLIGYLTLNILLAIIGAIALHIDAKTGYSRSIATCIVWMVRFESWRISSLSEPARPWPTSAATPRLDARAIRQAPDLYGTTNIWLAHLDFTREQWKALEPHYIGTMPNFMRPDGMPLLRNPNARRSGIAGVFGYEFDWTRGGFEFGGLAFTNIAVRVKGNLGSLCGPKRSFKVDLNKFVKGQKLAGLDELTFNSLFWDYSCLGDALGYEFFRDAGVPASRTAYAWLSASVAKKWDRKPLGLYLMVEPVDEEFAKERFGSKNTPVFKPVTYNLFEHLGDNWSAYATIYDLKTDATYEQQRRVIEFARLVSFATDAEFAARVADFLDLDQFARFLAGEVLLSNYDSILADGQNFYMYLHPRSNQFGFVPWDLDAAWGYFWLGTKQEFERASIWHPWVGENRFIQRVMAVEEFRRIYRAHLEDFLARLFAPDRLHQRIDEIAAVLRDPLTAESAFRLDKFEQAVGLKPVTPWPGETQHGLNHPAHQLKRFIDARAKSVRRQLDGESKGMILKYPAHK